MPFGMRLEKIELPHPTIFATQPYLVQQGMTVRRSQDQLVLDSPKEAELRIPLRQVERVLVFGNVQITTPVISACLETKIPIVFLTQMGEYKGHLWSAEATNLTIQTAQFARSQEKAFQLAMARSMVQAKLWNSKQFLLKLNRKRQLPDVVSAIAGLTQAIEAVGRSENSQTLDQIRGYEGSGAARYFAAFSQLIVHPDFTFSLRVFHPPTDPVNSLLSFGYTLLLNNVFSFLLAEGLNPYLGNLHGAERQKAYLAFDLMEEFRSPIVDTLVMKLINQKILQPTDFSWATEEGGIYLVEPARRVFLKHFEERISSATSHPDVQGQISYRRVIQLQVKRYVKAVLGNVGYQGFRRTI
ncbi:MAG: CRISPR-associated endonuclease Cas1 [Candidatus Parcubacteria bacterium]|nr:CRISPR-associated endonuclease Cas1 [Leptolyngbyaceae cyanobacterium LF-bin-113]